MIKRLYVDCETSGTDPKLHGIIQWTATVMIDGVEEESIDIKMQPFPDDEISDEALEVNNISREQLFDEIRLTPKQAYVEITRFLAKYISKFDKKDKFFWIGYNARFDADFTREFFNKNGDVYFGSWFWFPILDVAILAGYLLQNQRTKLPDFKLKTVWEFLHPDQLVLHSEDEWHDALFDIKRTVDVEAALRAIVMGVRRENNPPAKPPVEPKITEKAKQNAEEKEWIEKQQPDYREPEAPLKKTPAKLTFR